MDFEFNGDEATQSLFVLNALNAMSDHPVFCKFDITGDILNDAFNDPADTAEGAFSKRIGKAVYGYAVGIGADLATAKAALSYKDFQ